MKQKKGQGLSINTLVMIALAVFVVFLVLGFVTGGFRYFAGRFGEITRGTGSGEDSARIKCESFCTSYLNAGSPIFQEEEGDRWYDRLVRERYDVDMDGDGNSASIINPFDDSDPDDVYTCVGDTNRMITSGCNINMEES